MTLTQALIRNKGEPEDQLDEQASETSGPERINTEDSQRS
jgi:hypothetical protein